MPNKSCLPCCPYHNNRSLAACLNHPALSRRHERQQLSYGLRLLLPCCSQSLSLIQAGAGAAVGESD